MRVRRRDQPRCGVLGRHRVNRQPAPAAPQQTSKIRVLSPAPSEAVDRPPHATASADRGHDQTTRTSAAARQRQDDAANTPRRRRTRAPTMIAHRFARTLRTCHRPAVPGRLLAPAARRAHQPPRGSTPPHPAARRQPPRSRPSPTSAQHKLCRRLLTAAEIDRRLRHGQRNDARRAHRLKPGGTVHVARHQRHQTPTTSAACNDRQDQTSTTSPPPIWTQPTRLDIDTTHRPHRSLDQRPPVATDPPDQPDRHLQVVRTARCDGLIKEYRNAA